MSILSDCIYAIMTQENPLRNIQEPPAPRPAVQALQDVAHGALDFAELEQHHLSADRVLDFSTNTNPYGTAPGVRAALLSTPVDRYPDREALMLRRVLAQHLGVALENILAGNGSAELMWLAALTYLDAGQTALVIGPTFGEYARAAALMGARVDEWRAKPENGFAVDAAAIQAQLSRQTYRLVFLCNPNNPTGQTLPLERLAEWAQTHSETMFVVDEAYIAFCSGMPSAIDARLPNLLVLRSMTKDYVLTGLRLGYAVGDARVIAALRKTRPPWNVNAMAQTAGVAALQDAQYMKDSLISLQESYQALTAALRQRGYTVIPSAVHFFLMQVGDGARFRAALRPKGVLVRDCASFGLPDYVRIAARRPEENQRLLAAIDEVFA